jgi:hypothetical protein
MKTLFNKFHSLFINIWCEGKYFERDLTHVLSFYCSELERQQLN